MSVELGSAWLSEESGRVLIVNGMTAKGDGTVIVNYISWDNDGFSCFTGGMCYTLFLQKNKKLLTEDVIEETLEKRLKDKANCEYQRGLKAGKYLVELEYAEARQHHYDTGYNDALSHMASEEAEKEVVTNNEGYEDGFDDGYNTAIKEIKSDKLNSGVCGSNVPNKETQEAMQEVLDKGVNEFKGVWVAKDGSGKLKVVNINEGTCDVELIEHVSNSYLCVGDTATISIDDLKEHWTKEKPVDKEDNKHKYPHYFKDVSDLKWLDVYQVCKLFPIKDDSGAISHARKKLLVCGGRGGGKNMLKDIKEARDTLNRYLEIEGVEE